MRKLNDCISERTISEANYIVEKQTTIRATARAYNVSKSTVYTDITKRLECISLPLYTEVKKVLQKNKDERAERGGAATQRKYLEMKKTRYFLSCKGSILMLPLFFIKLSGKLINNMIEFEYKK